MFTRTKHGANKLAEQLERRRHPRGGDPRQQEPERAHARAGRLQGRRPAGAGRHRHRRARHRHRPAAARRQLRSAERARGLRAPHRPHRPRRRRRRGDLAGLRRRARVPARHRAADQAHDPAGSRSPASSPTLAHGRSRSCNDKAAASRRDAARRRASNAVPPPEATAAGASLAARRQRMVSMPPARADMPPPPRRQGTVRATERQEAATRQRRHRRFAAARGTDRHPIGSAPVAGGARLKAFDSAPAQSNSPVTAAALALVANYWKNRGTRRSNRRKSTLGLQRQPALPENAMFPQSNAHVSLTAALVFAIGALVTGRVDAQDYPSRPVRVIVPFSPGGAVDGPMRLIAQELCKRLGQAGRRREQARRRRDDRHRARRQGARPTATRCCSRRRPTRSARRSIRSCRSIRSRTSRRSR